MKYLLYRYYLFSLFFTLLTVLLWGCSNKFLVGSDEKKVDLMVENKQVIEAVYRKKETLNLCNQEKDQDLSFDSAKVYLVNSNEYLVELLCFLGAYQPSYQYFLVKFNSLENQEIKPIIFTTFQKQKQELKLTNTRTLTGIMDLDWETKQLILDTKGRALGDCGSFAIYQWSNYNFNLQEFRHKDNCDGVYLDPQDYPLIYP